MEMDDAEAAAIGVAALSLVDGAEGLADLVTTREAFEIGGSGVVRASVSDLASAHRTTAHRVVTLVATGAPT